MSPRWGRAAALVAALWGGVLLCIGLMAAPAGVAILVPADAGRVAGRLFAQEAHLSLLLAVVLFVVERLKARARFADGQGSQFSTEMVLLIAVLFCTVVGYFVVQPMMAAARAGQGSWSFGALHAVSGSFFALKAVLVVTLAWRLTAR